MTPEKQRTAIAEACGWKDLETKWHGYPQWLAPDGRVKYGTINDKFCCLPDYLNDRNAMVEALKTLTPRQREVFAYVLTYPNDPLPGEKTYIGYIELPESDVFDLLIAGVPQLAKTFLRTLNLWVEE
jgi:hypothetical protein